MKYFGQYLLENKLISEEQLVRAIVDQITETKALSAIAYQKQLLTNSQLLKVFEFQSQNDCDFKTACRSLQIWNETLEQDLQQEVLKSRPALGQILIRNQAIELSQLTQTLDDFFSSTALVSPQEPIPQTGASLDFSELFSLEVLKRLQSGFQIENSVSAENIFQEVHTLKGVAHFSQLLMITHLLDLLESKLTTAMKTSQSTSFPSEIRTLGKNTIDFLIESRNSIIQSGSEDEILKEKKDAYTQLVNSFSGNNSI